MARPPFTFDRNTLGSNGSFLLRFIAGRPFARAAHLKNAGHFTASLQEGQSACRSAVQGSRPQLGIGSKSDQIAVCRAFDIWRCRRPMGALPTHRRLTVCREGRGKVYNWLHTRAVNAKGQLWVIRSRTRPRRLMTAVPSTAEEPA